MPRRCREQVRALPADGVAVAGTPTSFAAIDLALEPYDRERVDGHRLSLARCEEILAQLARAAGGRSAVDVRGLHPDRAPTIVAGGIILAEAMRLFGLTEIEVSEHDILDGAAIEARRNRPETRAMTRNRHRAYGLNVQFGGFAVAVRPEAGP